MFDAPKLQPLLIVCLKIWRNPCEMLVDLRKNPSSGHLAPTRIKYGEVRCTQIVHKKGHFLPIRYFQERLKIANFFLGRVCELWPSLRTHEKGKHWSKTSSKPPKLSPYLFSYPAMFVGIYKTRSRSPRAKESAWNKSFLSRENWTRSGRLA